MNDQLQVDLKEAMLARDQLKVTVLKFIKSALTNERISLKVEELNEVQTTRVLQREAKKRIEAADLYRQGNKPDLAEQELAEHEIIKEYLPEQMGEDQLIKEVEAAVKELNANSPADMGKVMGYLSQKLKGKADNSKLAKLVKDFLVK